MKEPAIHLSLDAANGDYRPGSSLRGELRFSNMAPDDVRSIEVSVLWHTLGKGEEDLFVHFFQRETISESTNAVLAPRQFETLLPNSPLSYDGVLIKIGWCARARVYLRRSRELMVETRFRLTMQTTL